MTIPLPAAIVYAQLAFGVVLDQHEISILPTRVQAVAMADGAIGLIYETDECSASGRFTGDAQGGTLHLERVRTTVWDANFGTTDRFQGSQPDGTPTLLIARS